MNMKNKIRRAGIGAGAMLAIGLATGCTTYYKVTDADNGNVYYTTSVTQKGGSVIFTDARSDSRVSLDSSEVKVISKEHFEENVDQD